MLTTTERFASAMAYAYQVHSGQRRKGTGIPYIAHILGVAALAMEYGADEDQAIGALLHDAAEDGGGEATLAEIRARFGDAVADIVLGCSDSLVEDPEGKLPWQERKENYLAHLENAGQSVLLVSAADKLHNARAVLADLRTTGPATWDRFNAGPDDQLWYYSELVDVFRTRLPGGLSDDLADVVARMRALTGR